MKFPSSAPESAPPLSAQRPSIPSALTNRIDKTPSNARAAFVHAKDEDRIAEKWITESCNGDILDFCNTGDAPALRANRRIIYALVHRAFDDYHAVCRSFIPLVVVVLLITLVLGSLVLFGLMGLIRYVCQVAGMPRMGYGLYGFSFMVLGSGWYLKRILDSWPVKLECERKGTRLKRRTRISFSSNGRDHVCKGKVRSLGIGRLEMILDRWGLYWMVFYIGGLLGAEAGLIAFTPNYADLPFVQQPPGFADCIAVVADNHCQNVLFAATPATRERLFANNHFRPGMQVVFWLFRLSFEVLLVVFAVWVFWRLRIRRFFGSFPSKFESCERLADWIEDLSRRTSRLPRRFHDEFVFIMLAEEFIRGDYDLVKKVTHQFPFLNVKEEVRQLFVDDDRRPVFQSH